MKLTVVVTFVLIIGCSAARQVDVSPDQLEVVSLAPLPPLTSTSTAGGVTLDILFHILNNGTVLDARMLRSSGDVEWDSLALQSMKQWRFAVPHQDSVPADQWIRRRVIVQVQDPVVITLGEMRFPNAREADSVYALLQKGTDFDTLAKQVRGGSSAQYCRCPGAVDLSRYPRHVRDVLKRLWVNDVTHPLRLGTDYVVFKRFAESVAE